MEEIVLFIKSFWVPGLTTLIISLIAKSMLERQKANYATALADFKREGAAELANRKSNHDLSLVAIEKRLEVHQKAYSLWIDMKQHPAGDALSIYGDCLEFLKQNAIYLTSNARDAFIEATKLLEMCYIANHANEITILTEHLRKLEAQGNIIRDALCLPDIDIWKDNDTQN